MKSLHQFILYIKLYINFIIKITKVPQILDIFAN